MTDKVIPIAGHRSKTKRKKALPKYPSFSKREAQTIINRMARTSGLVHWGGHTSGRTAHRDFTRNDVIELAREGIIIEEPRLGDYGDWSYTVEVARFRGGRSAGVAVIIDKENQQLFIKTVMWID